MDTTAIWIDKMVTAVALNNDFTVRDVYPYEKKQVDDHYLNAMNCWRPEMRQAGIGVNHGWGSTDYKQVNDVQLRPLRGMGRYHVPTLQDIAENPAWPLSS